MKLQLQVFWEEDEVKVAELEISKDKFEPLSEEEKEAAIETIIRDYMNQHLAIKWELVDEEE